MDNNSKIEQVINSEQDYSIRVIIAQLVLERHSTREMQESQIRVIRTYLDALEKAAIILP